MKISYVLILCLLAFPALAQTTRYVDAGSGSNTANDCADPGSPCATLTHALAEADPGDTLEIAAGIYTESLAIDKDIAIHGETEATTIIQAHPIPESASTRVINISGQPEVEITDVTIRHGNIAGNLSASGGGLRSSGATLTLTHVTFRDNTLFSGFGFNAMRGGGLFVSDGDNTTLTNVTFEGNFVRGNGGSGNTTGGGMHTENGSPVLTDVSFIDNETFLGFGSGLYNKNGDPVLTGVTFSGNFGALGGSGMYTENASPILTSVVFEGNGAFTSGNGGGLYVFQGSPTLTDVVFEGNGARTGGGMYVDGDTVLSAPVLTDVAFVDNAGGGQSQGGGGMYNDNGSSPILNGVIFRGNRGENGGGMVNRNFSSPTLTNVIFEGNRITAFGGAGGLYNDNNSNPVLTNVIFIGNKGIESTGGVGGMRNNSDSSPTLINVTFSGNNGASAGAISNGSDCHPELTNVIIWDNEMAQGTAHPSASIFNVGGTSGARPVISHSLIANSGGSDNWDDVIGVDAGNNLDGDPLFIDMPDPAAAPTTDGDLRLNPDSPAIDAGDSDAVAGIDFDLDGNPRVMGPAVDMGAYERLSNALFSDRFEPGDE